MIDLHCHILPGMDDGAETLDESLRMARFSVQDGISFVVATPHCHRHAHSLRADVLPKVAQLNQVLTSNGIPLTIFPGSETQVMNSMNYRREFEAGLYCHLGDGRMYTLLEFNWAREQLPSDAVALVEWIRRQNMIPIVAHPERHDFFGREPTLLDAMVAAGAWLQITVDSLLGNHGSGPMAMGEALLKKYPEALLATDAHNMK